MVSPADKTECRVRLLAAADGEAVIAIDQSASGRSRRSFFEKRFATANSHPDDVIDLVAEADGVLCGFAMARILRGEFGRAQSVAVLDVIGVAPTSQGRGVGHALVAELVQRLRSAGVRSLQSQAIWTNHELLRFFAAEGFELAPRLALDRAVAQPLDETLEEV